VASTGGPVDGEVTPRWPVFVRVGDGDEHNMGEVFATDPGDLLQGVAEILRGVAAYMESRAD
jgi:hypothetical protein